MKTCIKRRGRIKNWFWAFKIKFDALFQCRKIGRPSSVNRHSTLYWSSSSTVPVIVYDSRIVVVERFIKAEVNVILKSKQISQNIMDNIYSFRK